MDSLGMLGIDKVAAFFTCAALLAYSHYFPAAYSIPKLLVLSSGLLVMALMVMGGAPVSWGRSLWAEGLLILGVCGVCAFGANDKWLALIGNHNSYALGMVGLSLAFFYHIAASGGSLSGKIPLVGALIGLHAFYQYSLENTGLSGNRAVGTIGSPVFLGMVLAVILPLALDESPIYGLAVALGLYAAQSRGAWAGAAIGLLAWGLASKKRAGLWAAVAVASVALAAVPLASRAYARSDSERIEVWKAAAKTALENPMIGVGTDGFSNAYRKHRSKEAGKDIAEDAHNDLLQAAATTGAFGLYSYAILALTALAWTAGPALGSLWALFANLKFNPIALEVLVLGAVICGACLTGDVEKKPLPGPGRILILLGAIVIAFVSGRLAWAEHYLGRGDFLSIQKACQLNPYELNYKVALFNKGIEEFNASKNIELKTAILKAMDLESQIAIRKRPASPVSWHMAARFEQIKQKVGWPADPEKYLSKVRELDPLR